MRGGIWALAAVLLGACGRAAPPPVTARARPVTVFALKREDPSRTATLTGSAEPYREENIAFEIPGRLDLVVAIGTELTGESTNEKGTPLQKGDLIARLDPTRYQLQVDALAEKINSSRKSLQAQDIEVKQVAPAEVKAARRGLEAAAAARRLAESNLAKAKKLLVTGAGTQQQVDDAQSAFDQAAAREQQAQATLDAREATVRLKQAQLAATGAQIAELEKGIERARADLEDCELRAPFNGRITRLFAARGAIVGAGTPVARLTMMDPMRISVAVSADTDRQLQLYDTANIFLRDPDITLHGAVIDKAETSDATRAFRVDIILRNFQRSIVPDTPELKGVAVVDEILPSVRPSGARVEGLYVGWDTIAKDESGYYILHIKGTRFGAAESVPRFAPLEVEKLRVKPGEEYVVIGRWYFRRLEDTGGLTEGEPLIIIPKDDGGAPIEHPDRRFKGRVVIGGKTWLIRPGELVSVSFALRKVTPGFYVPMEAILERNGATAVFLVEDGRARRVPVSVHETFRGSRRIEGEGLAAGGKIVLTGVHFVDHDDTVQVVREVGR